METSAPSALYPSIDPFRLALPETAPGNFIVVVPSSNANAVEEKKKYPRGNEALGSMQIVMALIHFALGGILLFSAKEFSPLAMNIWYPFWGGGLFFISGTLASQAATKPTEGLAAASHIFNTFSGLGAAAGTCILIMDLMKMAAVNLHSISSSYMDAVSFLSKYIIALPCEGIPNLTNYCRVIKAYETGIMCTMLFFSFLQIVTAFSTLCNSDKKKTDKSCKNNEEQNVVLLSAPQPSSADSFTVPPPYITTGQSRPFDTTTTETYIG